MTSANDLSGITTAILVGGLGTRLRSAVADRPKVLAEINGRPMLSYLLDQVAQAGVRRVVFCTGYRGEQVQAAFGTRYGALQLEYSQEPTPHGTAGAIRLALPVLQSDPVLAMNGDSVCEADLRAFYTWHCGRGASASLLLTFTPDVARYGQVQTDPDGKVRSFQEKGSVTGLGWINAGIYLLSRASIETIPVDRAVSIEGEMFPAWIGQDLYGYQSQGRFLDIGTPESYAEAANFFSPQGQSA